VLGAFDQWRRAVGISTSVVGPADQEGGETTTRPKQGGLQKHLDRVIDRLRTLRVKPDAGAAFGAALDEALDTLDGIRGAAKGARGDRRTALLARIAMVDEALLAAARDRLDAAARARLGDEADRELAPFRARMTDEVFQSARERSLARLVRQESGLPEIRFG
jgi:hypothetical protein